MAALKKKGMPPIAGRITLSGAGCQEPRSHGSRISNNTRTNAARELANAFLIAFGSRTGVDSSHHKPVAGIVDDAAPAQPDARANCRSTTRTLMTTRRAVDGRRAISPVRPL